MNVYIIVVDEKFVKCKEFRANYLSDKFLRDGSKLDMYVFAVQCIIISWKVQFFM